MLLGLVNSMPLHTTNQLSNLPSNALSFPDSNILGGSNTNSKDGNTGGPFKGAAEAWQVCFLSLLFSLSGFSFLDGEVRELICGMQWHRIYKSQKH